MSHRRRVVEDDACFAHLIDAKGAPSDLFPAEMCEELPLLTGMSERLIPEYPPSSTSTPRHRGSAAPCVTPPSEGLSRDGPQARARTRSAAECRSDPGQPSHQPTKLELAPGGQLGGCKPTTAPRSAAQLIRFLLAASGHVRDRHRKISWPPTPQEAGVV
jgi:hypothetical protein